MPDRHAGCLFLLDGDFNVEKFSGRPNPFNGVVDVGLSFMQRQRDIDNVRMMS